MSGAYREKDSADFDLEAFIDLFDEALMSNDESVQKTLQHLMVIAALARNHARHDHRDGPMRRMFENQRDLIRRLEKLESDNQRIYPGGGLGGGNVPLGPYYPPTTIGPNTGTWPPPNTGTIPPYPPGTIWGQSTNSTLDPGYGAVPPLTAMQVTDLLKDEKYKGSSLGTVDVKTA
jgi:hypothetical protein